jgi:hypothetical protein
MRQTAPWIRCVASLSVLVLGSGCSSLAAEVDEAPDLAKSELEARQVVSYGGWTGDALTPTVIPSTYFKEPNPKVWARASFAGAGTTPAGVCLLKQYIQTNGQAVTCNSSADCGSAPTALPTGGFRYCTWANGGGSGPKYCFYRPGSAANFCAGTPATGVPISAATLSTPYHYMAGDFISYACFLGCTSSDPSASSVAVAANPYEP